MPYIFVSEGLLCGGTWKIRFQKLYGHLIPPEPQLEKSSLSARRKLSFFGPLWYRVSTAGLVGAVTNSGREHHDL